MKLTQLSVSRPVTTFMFFLAIVLLGFVSLRELSVDLLPNISYSHISVYTEYPGVAPEEIESFITAPLEAAVSTVPGLRGVESISKEGVSYMTLEFAWGTDMDFAILHTREKLDNARLQLPEDAGRPTIIPLDPQSKPILILAVSGEKRLLELKEFSEELIKPRLEQIEGIGSAEIAGGVEREIQVEINPQLLSLYGLTIERVAQRIEDFNRSLHGGSIRKGRFKYALRVVGEFELVSEIGEINLQTTEERGVIRLKDVAEIKDSIKEREGLTRLNGEESIGILVRKESGANTVKVTGMTHQVLEEIKAENPQIEILVVSEQARYIENAISSVVKSIIIGGILAFLILFIFLQDVKTPIIIAVVIPISIIATFNLLYFRDITLNIMSLGGLALGVGMLVDNSIVVSESIFRHKGQGKKLYEAAYSGTKEVGMAVTASTLTTISVFLPIIYVHGVAGQLFKDQALAVTFALISSLVVSLTLLPTLASRKLEFEKKMEKTEEEERTKAKEKKNKTKLRVLLYPLKGLRWLLYSIPKIIYLALNFILSYILQLLLFLLHYLSIPFKPVVRVIFKGFNFVYQKFASRYHQFLLWSLENKRKVLIGSLIFLGVTFLLATQMRRELMPKPETAAFEFICKTPVDYPLEQTTDISSAIERWLKEESVKLCFSQIGLVSGMESMNPDVSLNTIRIYVELQKSSEVESVIENLRRKLSSFPDLAYSIVREQSALVQFLAFQTAELGLKIKGDDLYRLKEIAEKLTMKLEDIDGIADLNSNIGEGKPEFLIKINKEALEKYSNLSPAFIGNFLVDAVRGKVATQFKELERKYDILVRLEMATRLNIESLLDEQIPYQGTVIPLRELVSYDIVKGPEEIRRENQQREVLVTANLRGVKISQVAPEIRKKINELSLPSNYRVVFSGEQEEMSKSFKSLIFAFCLAVLLVYMIMAAQFESLIHPFLILFTLPMGLIGAFWALFLTGQTLNVISVIGMVVLAGIVVNDAIVKIDYTNQLRKRGWGLREAIMEASRVRLRPILMTTVTTAFGLFPMSLGLGKGAELQRPLAISVIGGLILATFLTLIIIPLVYEIAAKKKHRYGK
ncbi:MAG: efflux RND transporter permease subunit [Candidatus Aminicenantaceae bacterium]